jgi:general secretion pathway protein B
MPDALRGDLPPLAVGGSVYSAQPEARMLILNGRVFREGDAVAPDLVLEQIRQRSAVLRWRDQRFSLPY